MPLGRSAVVHQALWRDLASGEFPRRRVRTYTVGIPVFLLAFLRTVPHAFALRNNAIEGSAREIECNTYPLARLQLRAGRRTGSALGLGSAFVGLDDFPRGSCHTEQLLTERVSRMDDMDLLLRIHCGGGVEESNKRVTEVPKPLSHHLLYNDYVSRSLWSRCLTYYL